MSQKKITLAYEALDWNDHSVRVIANPCSPTQRVNQPSHMFIAFWMPLLLLADPENFQGVTLTDIKMGKFTDEFYYPLELRACYAGLEDTVKCDEIFSADFYRYVIEGKGKVLFCDNGECLYFDAETADGIFDGWDCVYRFCEKFRIPPEKAIFLRGGGGAIAEHQRYLTKTGRDAKSAVTVYYADFLSYLVKVLSRAAVNGSRFVANDLLNNAQEVHLYRKEPLVQGMSSGADYTPYLAKMDRCTNRLRNFKFNALNRNLRTSRMMLGQFLIGRDYLKDGMVSLPPFSHFRHAPREGHLNFFNKKLGGRIFQFQEGIRTFSEEISGNRLMTTIDSNQEIYAQTYFGVVTETFYFENWDNELFSSPYRFGDGREYQIIMDHTIPFISEKILKNFRGGNFFVCFGRPGILNRLHGYGLKTFDWLIDESYDQEADDFKRFEMIIDQIDRVLSLSKQQIHDAFMDHQDLFVENAETIRTMQTDFDRVIEILR